MNPYLVGELGEDDGEADLGVVLLEVGLKGAEADIVPVDSLVIELGGYQSVIVPPSPYRHNILTVQPWQLSINVCIHSKPLGREDIAGVAHL